jgi:hypothetical protein
MTKILTIAERKEVEDLIVDIKMKTPEKWSESAIRYGLPAMNKLWDIQLLSTYEYLYGTKHPLDPTLETPESDGWKNGYETGLTWDANYYPGGPHKLYSASDFDRIDEKVRRCRQSLFNYENWHLGFKAGLAERMKYADFNRWWEENHGKKSMRYKVP